jgi:hypothetical protein
MSSVECAIELLIRKWPYGFQILVPDERGSFVNAASPHFLSSAVYVSSSETLDSNLRQATQELNKTDCLLLDVRCSDGPPCRSCLLFKRVERMPGSSTERYRVATSQASSYVWAGDRIAGKQGFFVTGSVNSPVLWRICRMETDIANRLVFTLSPIQLANGLPNVHFEKLPDTLLAAEAGAQWTEVQKALNGLQYRSLVIAAKNVAEAVAATLMPSGSQQSKRTLGHILVTLDKSLKDKTKKTRFSRLDYHLMAKLTELHSRIHPERARMEGRSVAPELALTTVQDLVEVLRSVGLVEGC